MLRKIKSKMTLAVSLLVLSLMFITAWTSLVYFEREIKELVTNQQYALVASTAHIIDERLFEIQGMVKTLAGMVTPEILTTPDKAQKLLDERVFAHKLINNSLFLFNTSGRLIAAYPARTNFIGADFSFRNYLKKTIATGKPQISEPFLSRQTPPAPIVMFTAPVRDAAGRLIAVAGGSIDLARQDTLKDLATIKWGEKGYFHLYDKKGTFIAHHDSSKVLQQVKAGTNPLFDKAIAGFEGTAEGTTTCGVKALITTVQLKSSGWILEAGYPLAVAYAPIHTAKRYFIGGGLAAVLISLLFIWFLMTYLLEPILTLTRQVRGMTEPEALRQPVRVDSRDEVGQLADAFNGMLAEVEHEKVALLEQLDFSQSLINTIPIPVCYKDTQGAYLGCNSAFESFMGIRKENLIGKCSHEVMSREAADIFLEAEQAVLEEQGIHVSESSIYGADCFKHEVVFYRTPFFNHDGSRAGLVGAMLDITEQKKTETILQEIAGSVSSEIGENFFLTLVEFLAKTLNADFVFISRIIPTQPDMAETLAVFDHGTPGVNFCYPLKGTPCEYVVGKGIVTYPKGLREVYPENPYFSAMGVESYVGATITDSVEKVTGFLVILSVKPLENAPLAESLLKIFAIRASAELQRITAEKEIKRARDFYLTLFEEFPTLIWCSGPDAKCSYVNSTWLKFTGRSLEEELGDGWCGLVHPDDLKLCCATYNEAFVGRKPFQVEARLRRHDGEYRWLLSMGRPFYDLDGNFAGYIRTSFDRTDEKVTDEQLRTMSGAVEQNPSVIIITDARGIIRYANRKHIEMTGFDLRKTIGYDLSELSSKVPGICTLLETAIASGQECQRELEGINDDGNEYWVAARISPILNSKGEISHFCITAEDVTEHKALENQLRHAQKMEAIGTLAGGIAHDFNNILTAIMGYSELIGLECPADSPIRPYLQKLLASAGRATTLTRSLLAYSRKQPLATLALDINVIVNNVGNLLSRLLRDDIDLAISPAENPLTVQADSLQIEQVLMNLVTNARDAMPAGGLLQISTSSVELDAEFLKTHGYGEPGDYARISVSDNGSGMDDKMQAKIFEPFFTTKEVNKGTGLGLSIAYGIIKQHKGFINVYSELGQGTTFTIYLPLIKKIAGECESAKEDTFISNGNETLLLVEDDQEIRSSLGELLKGKGYTVIEAVNGEDGVQKFRDYADSIQLVILDVMMPKKSGRAAYDEILAIRPGTKALFISGYTADLLTAQHILEKEINFISKPVSINSLHNKIRGVLAV